MTMKNKSRWTKTRMPYSNHAVIFASTLRWDGNRFGDAAGRQFPSASAALAALAESYGRPVSVTGTRTGALGQAIEHDTDLVTAGGLRVRVLEYPEILELRDYPPEWRVPGFTPTTAR